MPKQDILHSCLSFTDEYVGMKLAEALKANGYDLDSPYLKPYVDVIKGVSFLKDYD